MTTFEGTRITRDELLTQLRDLARQANEGDAEEPHMDADALLLRYIDDPEITDVFESMRKWYA